MYLIDSSVWIEYLKPNGSPTVRDRIRTILQKEEAACCGIVVVELLRGARNEKDYRALRDSLLFLPQLPLDQNVIETAAHWGYSLDRQGKIVSTPDLLIAAAARNKAIILHVDSHFEVIGEEFDVKQEKVA